MQIHGETDHKGSVMDDRQGGPIKRGQVGMKRGVRAKHEIIMGFWDKCEVVRGQRERDLCEHGLIEVSV